MPRLVHSSQLLVHSKKTQGFTLIELLVVTAIIAILTAVAISTYSGIQARARDTKRMGDIDEFRKALELNYVEAIPSQPAYYPTPTGLMFSDGVVPIDPKPSQSYTITVTPGIGIPYSNWTSLGGRFPTYIICAKLEIKASGNANENGNFIANGDYYCKQNAR